jgi:hypothetical protein
MERPPPTDSFGQIAGDNDAWGAGRGAVQAYDGTSNTYLVGVLASDTPANGQVPKWNTGGTITWEDDATGAGGGDAVTVNGAGVTDANLNDSAPAAPAGGVNVQWQTSGSGPADVSAYVPASPNSSATVVGTARSLTGGAGIAAIGDLSADRTIATASGEANFLASGALTCGAGTQGKMQVHTTPLQYCDNAATPALQYAAYGDSAGNALTGDSATAFFSSGTLEDARLSANVSLLGQDIALGSEVSGILPGANGGTGNGFFTVSGPATALKTFTFPNASATVLTSAAAVTIPQGGTGGAPGADDQALISDSTSAATWRTLPNGAISYATSTNSLAQAGISNLAASTSADLAGVLSDETGSSGGFVRATSPTLTTPNIASIVNSGTLSLPTSTDTLVGRATSDTLTNKTLNAESTGNTLTTVEKITLVAAGCNNTAAAPGWDVPSTNGPAASCFGTSPQRFGGLDFPDGASALTSTTHLRLPSDWTGNIDATFLWFSGSTSTSSVVWTVATSCVADSEGLLSPTFNTTQTVSDANNATANTRNSASITSLTTTGCSPGETLFLRIGRDPTNGSDTLAATASLLELEITLRRAQ